MNDPTLEMGQSGFMKFWLNSVRFSTFLNTEKEILHTAFTTMRFFVSFIVKTENGSWEAPS